MYLEFYGLDREPFHITPDPEFLYLSPSHKEALAVIIYGVEQRKGFISITGEVGLGKTTILHSYLAQADDAKVRTVFVFNANVTYDNLLKFIAQELGVSVSSERTFEMLHGLHMALIEEYNQGHNVVLLIDEAQNMPIETLENLRMLSNLETSKEKLLQIILVGQPELDAVLDRAELRQLKQRIAVRSVLSPLSPKESYDYIQHRLTKCGGDIDSIFSKSALKLINRHAAGIPRKINIICDNVLINGYGYMQKPVSAKVVREVLADLEGRSRKFPLKWVFLGLAVLVSLAAILWLSLYGSNLLSSIVNVGQMTSRSTPSPGDKRPPPAPLREDAQPKDSAASSVGMKVRKEVPGVEERPVESTPSTQSLPQEPLKPEPPPAGALQTTSEPAKVLEAPKPALSSSQVAPSEKENKKAADSPKTDPVPPPREVQKADEKKDRASGSPPDPSEIVDWLLKKRSSSDR